MDRGIDRKPVYWILAGRGIDRKPIYWILADEGNDRKLIYWLLEKPQSTTLLFNVFGRDLDKRHIALSLMLYNEMLADGLQDKKKAM